MKKKVIGITGGIGSGKSVVMDVLKNDYHAATILADQVGNDLMQPGQVIYKELIREFGPGILKEDGTIQKAALSEILFKHPEKWEVINGIEHPLILKEILRRIEEYSKDPEYEFIALEAALLVELGYKKYLDELWYIYVDEDTRVKRLLLGRGYSEEKSRNFMKQQLSEEEFRKACDVVIDNSRDLEFLRKQLKNHLI